MSKMNTAITRGLRTSGGFNRRRTNDLKRLQLWNDKRHIKELISADLGNRAAEAAESFEMLCAYNMNREIVMKTRLQLKFMNLLALALSAWFYGWSGLTGGKVVWMIILICVAIFPLFLCREYGADVV